MQSVSVTRHIDAPAQAVLSVIQETEPFMAAMGVDSVSVDGSEIHVTNEVGPKRIELLLRETEVEGAVFAYEHVEGIFEEMTTTYILEDRDDGSVVTGSTEFTIDAPVAGWFLDATVISFQRRRELNLQFDHIEAQTQNTR